jgi:cytoskeleton protein RodZ
MVPQIQGKPVAEKIAPELKPAAPVKSAPQAIAPPALPTVAAPVKPAAQPGVVNNGTETATAAIKLTFDSDSWVEITDKHGKILLSQINAPGSEQSISGTPPFALVIGHAKEVHLFYKGRAVDLAPYTKVAVAHLTLE